MKILSLQAENVKRLKAVEIRPNGNLVEITGRNGQGKTSCLDAIWWALAGTKHIQSEPIRKGADEARIRLDLGEIKITRSFRRKGDEQPSTLVVESAEGARFPSPQNMLDALVGALSFDPLAFTRLDGKGKFDALRKFVPGVDFDQIAAEQKSDFQARTDVNRRAKEARAAAESIQIPADTPETSIDETALVQALENAGEENRLLEQRKARREQVARDIAQSQADAKKYREEIRQLQHQIEILESDATLADQEAVELQKKLDDAGPLPCAVETTSIRQQIESARRTNALVAKRAERAAYQAKAKKLEEDSEAITARMRAREEAKQKAVASAKMPIPGLEFGEGEVLLNGVPFEQGSDAEQLRASIAIAMAMNPKLRVIRVRDGSLMDSDSKEILSAMAAEADCQVWIETVGGSGPAAIVIEDGMVKTVAAQAAE